MTGPSSRVPPRRMGRPPLGLVKTTVALPPDVVERIEALVGQGGVAGFLREAVREKLELDKRQSSADE